MPLRPPLVPHESSLTDPPELPARHIGEEGPATVVRAALVSCREDGVTLAADTTGGGELTVHVDAAGDGIIRVRASVDPAATTQSSPALDLLQPVSCRAPVVNVHKDRIQVTAGPLSAIISLSPWGIRFLDENDRPLVETSPGERDALGRLRTLPLGRSYVDEETTAYHECLTAQADEDFVGFGERFTELNARGQRRVMWNFDTSRIDSDKSYKNIPFYLSSRGYGLLVHSGTPVEFDVCQSAHSCVQIVAPDSLIDYFVLAGPHPSAILHRYNQLTCRPVHPPKWTFGTWFSVGARQRTQNGIIECARALRASAIPADVLSLGFHWQAPCSVGVPRWDRERFPDPEGMVEALGGLGFRVCLTVSPYINRQSSLFADAAERGFLLCDRKQEIYLLTTRGHRSECGLVDLTDASARAWFASLLTPLLEQGVALFETDLAEGVPSDAVAANGMTGTSLHNVYSLLLNDVVAAATHEVTGYDLVWTCSTFLGGQRHPAQGGSCAPGSYQAMASALRGGLSHGLSGIPFWSHDVRASAGDSSPDLYVRWAQFGALSPLTRFHGSAAPLPWECPEHTAKAIGDVLRLRYELMPYLYSAAAEAAEFGTPMMRAPLIDSPDDPAAWGADLEYRLGRDLLVAPMVNSDGTRMVYLPAGEWADHWTGIVHGGGRYIRVTPPLDRPPLFVRHGALIPTMTAPTSLGDRPFPEITLVSWGGRTARTTIYDRGGVTTVMATRTGERLDLRTKGPAVIQAISFAFVHGGQPPRSVLLNGKHITIE